MRLHFAAVVILWAALVCITVPVSAQEGGSKTAPFRFPGLGVGLNLGITSAVITVEGSGLLFDGGGLEIGGMAGAYPVLFGEMGVEAMRFDLTTESDRVVNQRVRVEMYGYYAGGGVGLPLDGGGAAGVRYRIQRKSLVKLEIENRDTGETDLFRDHVTRRSYFLFLAIGSMNGKNGKKGNWLEIGVRYDDVDKNIFLISDVLGIYLRTMLVF
ncbi:MAG: hypothetical protein IIC15_04910 [Thaumarchaeota archaeon]|nr:hypothetical protein [Nitrososphaerota archaeon]